MTARFSNQFQSYLTEPLNIDATVINIPPEDVKRLPILNDTDWCPLNINDPRGYEEIVHVTKVNADGSLTVKRAQEGTEAKNFRMESRVDIRLTAQSIESFLGLYYGSRTVPPSNAQTGAAYLDISKKPNVLKVLGENGWADAVSYSLAGLRQQLFVPTETTKGPFTVQGGFTNGFANVNGLSVYDGHGMTIDAANASFKLDNEVPAGTIIVFQGYLANDAVDVFTKAEINERFSNLSTGQIKETDDRKFMTADERDKLATVDDRFNGLTAGQIKETDDRKFMTADERQSIAKVVKHVDGLTTNDVKETPDHKYFPPNFNADSLPETKDHKVMTAAEREKLANINALAAAIWNTGTDETEALISPAKLRDAVNARFGGDLSTGWARMPNGLLLQWGHLMSDTGSQGWAVFPTAFTKQCIFLPTMSAEWISGVFAPIVFAWSHLNDNLDGRSFYCRQINGNSGVSELKTWQVDWLAIGY